MTIDAEDTVAGFDAQVTVADIATSERDAQIHLINPEGTESVIGPVTTGTSTATLTIPSGSIHDAGTYRVIALRGDRLLASDTFDVVTNRVDESSSSIQVSREMFTADGRDSVTVTVRLTDASGNPLPQRPVQLISSRGDDRITALTGNRETNADGAVQFAVQTLAPGIVSLRAMDLITGTLLSASAHIAAMQSVANASQASTPSPLAAQVAEAAAPKYDVLANFEVTVKEASAKVADILPLVSIRAVDKDGKTVESFTGKVAIKTPNDPSSTLPGLFEKAGTEILPPDQRAGTVTFSGKNRGTFPIAWTMAFSTPGAQRIVVTDESGTVSGETSITITGNAQIPDSRRIRILKPTSTDTLGGSTVTVDGTGPALRNLRLWIAPASADPAIVKQAAPAATGETDAKGAFHVALPLPSGAAAVLVIIRDQDGLYDSGPQQFAVDTAAPKIDVEIDPKQPQENEPVTVTVRSEPALPVIELMIGDRTIPLTETTPGVYSAIIPAPKRSMPNFSVRAADASGNAATAKGILSIQGPDLPQVQNVKVKPLAGSVSVSWDLIPDARITGYRIEVGRTQDRADLSLDSTGVVDTGVVGNLKAGIDYFFTVRPMSGTDVGPRSAVVSSRTLGMDVTVAPQDGSLLVQWTFPDATPLASFELTYGLNGETSVETIMLDGEMRVFTIRDLLPKPYALRLTPIAVTGQRMDELAVTATGTPGAASLHPAADDGTGPFIRPDDTPPSNDLHSGVTENINSGLGNWLLGIVGIVAGAAVMLRLRRRTTKTSLDEFLMRMDGRYHAR
jgi:hypothetical protein